MSGSVCEEGRRPEPASRATLLCFSHLTPLEKRLARLVEFLGVDHTTHIVSHRGVVLDGAHHCVMVSASALGALIEADGSPARSLQRVFACTRNLFVYGFRPTVQDSATARHLSRGLIDEVVHLPEANQRYTVAADGGCGTEEFSGLTFGPIQPSVDHGFSASGSSAGLRSIVSIGRVACFASFRVDDCTVFMLACGDIADLDAQIDDKLRPIDWFSRIVPASMFIRHVFGRRCWHRSRPSATFVIDDPLLTESYGFLNYRRLLDAMRDQAFSASIAFIPLTYRRSRQSVVDFFLSRPRRLSLCIHGCDHTSGEFAATDLSRLNALTKLADDRMNALKRVTGLDYDKVMVFPQGRFSTGSLEVLRHNNFLAAVNTTPIPQDALPGEELTIREWLDVGVTRYRGVPLFVRRYPGEIVECAFDLYFGKPLLIVEHHTAFRDGYRDITAFIARLNSLNVGLKWGGLHWTLSRTYTQRELSDDTVAARIWTNFQVIQNDSVTRKRYLIAKTELADAPIRQVTVDNDPVEFTIDQGILRLAIDVQPCAERVIQIQYENALPMQIEARSLRARVAVQGRRRLSEFRDNYLCKHSRLLELAGFAARRLSRSQ